MAGVIGPWCDILLPAAEVPHRREGPDPPRVEVVPAVGGDLMPLIAHTVQRTAGAGDRASLYEERRLRTAFCESVEKRGGGRLARAIIVGKRDDTPARALKTGALDALHGEREGVIGGRGYRAAHDDEMDKHVLAVESDSGGYTPRGFRSNANAEALAMLRDISSLLGAAGADEVTRGGGGADIGPMANAGVVLVGFRPDGQRYFDLHHTPEDTIDKVHPRELNLGAGVIASLLYVAAEMEGTLPRNPN